MPGLIRLQLLEDLSNCGRFGWRIWWLRVFVQTNLTSTKPTSVAARNGGHLLR